MPAATEDARTICLLTYCCLTDYLPHFSANYLAHTIWRTSGGRYGGFTTDLGSVLADGAEGDVRAAEVLPVQVPASGITEPQARLRRMVLDAVIYPHSRRNYAKALDDLFAFAAGRPCDPGAVAARRDKCFAVPVVASLGAGYPSIQ